MTTDHLTPRQRRVHTYLLTRLRRLFTKWQAARDHAEKEPSYPARVTEQLAWRDYQRARRLHLVLSDR